MDQLTAEIIENEEKEQIELSENEYSLHEALSHLHSKSIENYNGLKGQSGIYILWIRQRMLYIGCAENLYLGIYERVAPNGSNNDHFLLKEVTGFTFIPLKEYNKEAAKIFRDLLIEKEQPLLNILNSKHNWYNKYISRHFRKNEEFEALRAENEELKTALDDLISAAMKIRKEK